MCADVTAAPHRHSSALDLEARDADGAVAARAAAAAIAAQLLAERLGVHAARATVTRSCDGTRFLRRRTAIIPNLDVRVAQARRAQRKQRRRRAAAARVDERGAKPLDARDRR